MGRPSNTRQHATKIHITPIRRQHGTLHVPGQLNPFAREENGTIPGIKPIHATTCRLQCEQIVAGDLVSKQPLNYACCSWVLTI